MDQANESSCPLSCADCGTTNCRRMDKTFPPFCLSENMDKEVLEEALALYKEDENQKSMIAAAVVENDHYCQMTRIEEIAEYAKLMNMKRIGLAFCVGLANEAHILARFLRAKGFEVYGVACKVGCVPKHEIGIPQRCETIGRNTCNPILQAKLLNKVGTDLNVVVGLCVGHDSLFYKYSDALCTTAVTKDRVLGHNPVAALYQADNYYKKKLF